MQPVPVWRDLLESAALAGWVPGQPVPPTFAAAFRERCWHPHRSYFDGLDATYGTEIWGATGAANVLLARAKPLLEAGARSLASDTLEQEATTWLDRSRRLLPGPAPHLYIAPLNFIAPAATVSVAGRPSVVLAPERFTLTPPPLETPKFTYTPQELCEMMPHEACHAARMGALGLPATPRQLSLLEMVMLEGTALVFSDQLVGRTTLRTFLPPAQMAWHEANEDYVLATAAQDFPHVGMSAFVRYFSSQSPISGYYVGYSLCRRYLDRYGPGSLPELVVMPAQTVLARLHESAVLGQQ